MSADTPLALDVIAHMRTDFPDKFGLPRQSGLAEHLMGRIVFEPKYRDQNALRGIEGFSHLWLIWGFSEAVREKWSPTVRPPRLGGNRAMGVFATRSPFRPNPLGLSCVRFERLEDVPGLGTTVVVRGIDMTDMTPVYDIKPYIPYADSRPDALGGFTDGTEWHPLEVAIPPELARALPDDAMAGLREALAQDPRPAYRRGDARVFGMDYAGCDVRFRVIDGKCEVVSIIRNSECGMRNQ
ncbi:MAG: tRNA (N6-threonylcarbamoyladenosine(37)-N6)-methyltransferase TrmO [Clostridiales bacterium]|nr:tRNA (N6-threonylcarbamoyladenosine(37)-N6)-methyltransferase TrmO [Clostridiales bacterium]